MSQIPFHTDPLRYPGPIFLIALAALITALALGATGCDNPDPAGTTDQASTTVASSTGPTDASSTGEGESTGPGPTTEQGGSQATTEGETGEDPAECRPTPCIPGHAPGSPHGCAGFGGDFFCGENPGDIGPVCTAPCDKDCPCAQDVGFEDFAICPQSSPCF